MKIVRNDGGQAAAGYIGKAGDCVARAIAITAELDYQTVYDALAHINATMPKTKRRRSVGSATAARGIYVRSVLFKRYMAQLGFVWTPTMAIGSGCTVHLREGELPPGRLVVAVSRHYTSVIDGVIYDTHDCSRGGSRCVYGYWRLT